MFEVHVRVVDGGHTVGGAQEAGDLGIGFISCGDILGSHALDSLTGAASLTDLLTGGQQNTHFGIRSHHGGDVTALGHNTQSTREGIERRLACDVRALRCNEHVPDRNDVRHFGHVRGHLSGTNRLGDVLAIGVHAGIVRIHGNIEMVSGEELPHRFGDDTLIHGLGIKVDAAFQAPPRAGAVHCARIQVCIVEVLGQRLGRG